MGRRTFLGTLAGGLLAVPLAAEAQPAGRVWRIGFLAGGGRTADGAPPAALRQGLLELGYVEGRNVTYAGRWAEAKRDRLPRLVAELVDLKVDVIVAVGGPAAEAAKEATSSIPIVFAYAGDAVGTGLIASLARPGGNVTGITDEAAELSTKRLEVLKEAVPRASRIAVLWNADDRAMTLRYRQIEKAASVLHVRVQPLGVREPEDLALAFPAMYEFSFLVRDGGLMSYGWSLEDNFHRAASYVDRILKGAKPADLPVEQPTRYYLVINLTTAKGLGLTIPPSVLVRADEIIQ